MARPLSDADVEAAVRLLDGWTDKLTWDRYLAVLGTQLGHQYSRPGLLKHPRIRNAWEMRQKRLRESAGTVGRTNGDAAIAHLHQVNQTLRAENERLRQENQDLLERFQRWAYHAAAAGLTPERLDADMIPLRRPQT